MKGAIFIDKDGTLLRNVPHNVDPARIQWETGVEEGLALLHRAGFPLIVVTNQSGVALGYFREDALARVRTRIEELFDAISVPLAGFYYCPHHPQGVVSAYSISCACRKPKPGLLYRAAREQGLDLAASWFIGDILDDIEAGRRAGCRTILIDSGNETEWKLSALRYPHFVARDVATAARIILEMVERAKGGDPLERRRLARVT